MFLLKISETKNADFLLSVPKNQSASVANLAEI